jgi:purine nucleoside phosphorylase
MEGDLARCEATKEYVSTLEKATKFLQSKGIDAPEVGMILGSGLKDFASTLKNPIVCHQSHHTYTHAYLTHPHPPTPTKEADETHSTY